MAAEKTRLVKQRHVSFTDPWLHERQVDSFSKAFTPMFDYVQIKECSTGDGVKM